ncbi:hypothetical protein F0562_024504 [Nyssa sinensis]|uniref:Transcriptional coactivator Hfi1/Transcriptional adapter 1 n=1 Tax=Nyssa sinensis TaxID=561372 RepID=A0A5J5BFT6_9ASTE|nr:hypothetical protein F0562_024504 [Nyssa sinensis]
MVSNDEVSVNAFLNLNFESVSEATIRLLSLKLSKVEFNKLCLQIVGRENIPLHNQFVRSILKNACNAKVPPSFHDKDVFKSTKAAADKEPANGYQKSGLHPSPTQDPNPLALSNGDILPFSSRRVRSGINDRRVGDRPSPLGPNGKVDFASQQSTTTRDNDSNVILENGDLTQCDIQRPVQHHQGIMEQAENESDMHHLPAKLSSSNRLPDGSVSVHSKDQIEGVVEHGKEVSARSLLHAPLGIPFCPVSVGAAHKAMHTANSSICASSFDSGGLLDTKMLRERMELIAATQGLEGVPMDCANLLNNGLEAYLKRLIKSCIELVGARSGQEPTKNSTHKHQAHGKLVNGVRPGHHYQMQSSSRPLEDMQEQRPHYPISLLDFRIAMELKPQQLGEDWPLLLEKICTHAFEE